jgi:hypothetical protein
MDAYRIDHLPVLFPNSDIKVIHLVRNPAAAINGLIDGWLSRGFFSHNLTSRAELNIGGYSERGAWATSWWNFDLPPGWRTMVDQPLAHVCAYQWTAAHASILRGLEATWLQVLRVRAEEVIDERTQPLAVARILRYCDAKPVSRAHSGVVMATHPPEPGRWRKRSSALSPILDSKDIRQLSTLLGYSYATRSGWT